MNKENNKIAVYSALCGVDIELKRFSKRFKNCDYILFSDKISSHPDWDVRPILKKSFDPIYATRRNTKRYKLLPHTHLPGYKYYIWHDITHELISDPWEMVEEFLISQNCDAAFFKHPERNCVYEEAEACMPRDWIFLIKKTDEILQENWFKRKTRTL